MLWWTKLSAESGFRQILVTLLKPVLFEKHTFYLLKIFPNKVMEVILKILGLKARPSQHNGDLAPNVSIFTLALYVEEDNWRKEPICSCKIYKKTPKSR